MNATAAHGITSKHPSATKRGPGRYHHAGHTKATPVPSKGVPSGFVLHKASAEKQERRNTMQAIGGRRQYLRKTKALLRAYAAATAC